MTGVLGDWHGFAHGTAFEQGFERSTRLLQRIAERNMGPELAGSRQYVDARNNARSDSAL